MLVTQKRENIIDEVSNEEMQDFFVWLQKNKLLNTNFSKSGFFELASTHEHLKKFRAEKNAS